MSETSPPPAAARAMPNHRAVEYTVRDFDDQVSGFVVTTAADGRQITVSGICPGCGGRTRSVWNYGSGNGHKGIFGAGRHEQRPPDRMRTLCCECGHAHANRPESEVFIGCGALWRVELP